MSPALAHTPNFVGWRALILHRPHQNVDALTAQCARIGIAAEQAWPTLENSDAMRDFNVLLIDADMGHDEQFPWAPGLAPMPMIALIGSEAPGRIAWTIGQGADAQLLKPIGSAGLYSALVVASQGFLRRTAQTEEIALLKNQLAKRQVVAEATAILMLKHNCDAEAAYNRLRKAAMAERRSIEKAAAGILANFDTHGRTNVTNGR
ncbi:ANTAR domain-containing protein [Nitratireductor rhodophyticola]|uniref:ANTAR domain-containing response regulator n=1 Tax=Nitratireductor rhodophyticola TaxID=2854036 RepID=UPI002AC95D51|nr:ANTAR domain-containing protein [Nitratireductor rhodophyticola]WPZ14734.1 ANTAR domain-containing protein [Nitratireductor rhodophyticola]